METRNRKKKQQDSPASGLKIIRPNHKTVKTLVQTLQDDNLSSDKLKSVKSDKNTSVSKSPGGDVNKKCKREVISCRSKNNVSSAFARLCRSHSGPSPRSRTEHAGVNTRSKSVSNATRKKRETRNSHKKQPCCTICTRTKTCRRMNKNKSVKDKSTGSDTGRQGHNQTRRSKMDTDTSKVKLVKSAVDGKAAKIEEIKTGGNQQTPDSKTPSLTANTSANADHTYACPGTSGEISRSCSQYESNGLQTHGAILTVNLPSNVQNECPLNYMTQDDHANVLESLLKIVKDTCWTDEAWKLPETEDGATPKLQHRQVEPLCTRDDLVTDETTADPHLLTAGVSASEEDGHSGLTDKLPNPKLNSNKELVDVVTEDADGASAETDAVDEVLNKRKHADIVSGFVQQEATPVSTSRSNIYTAAREAETPDDIRDNHDCTAPGMTAKDEKDHENQLLNEEHLNYFIEEHRPNETLGNKDEQSGQVNEDEKSIVDTHDTFPVQRNSNDEQDVAFDAASCDQDLVLAVPVSDEVEKEVVADITGPKYVAGSSVNISVGSCMDAVAGRSLDTSDVTDYCEMVIRNCLLLLRQVAKPSSPSTETQRELEASSRSGDASPAADESCQDSLSQGDPVVNQYAGILYFTGPPVHEGVPPWWCITFDTGANHDSRITSILSETQCLYSDWVTCLGADQAGDTDVSQNTTTSDSDVQKDNLDASFSPGDGLQHVNFDLWAEIENDLKSFPEYMNADDVHAGWQSELDDILMGNRNSDWRPDDFEVLGAVDPSCILDVERFRKRSVKSMRGVNRRLDLGSESHSKIKSLSDGGSSTLSCSGDDKYSSDDSDLSSSLSSSSMYDIPGYSRETHRSDHSEDYSKEGELVSPLYTPPGPTSDWSDGYDLCSECFHAELSQNAKPDILFSCDEIPSSCLPDELLEQWTVDKLYEDAIFRNHGDFLNMCSSADTSGASNNSFFTPGESRYRNLSGYEADVEQSSPTSSKKYIPQMMSSAQDDYVKQSFLRSPGICRTLYLPGSPNNSPSKRLRCPNTCCSVTPPRIRRPPLSDTGTPGADDWNELSVEHTVDVFMNMSSPLKSQREDDDLST